MSANQVKNTMLHLNGQNLRLAAKNRRSPKAPGHHVSGAYEKEVAGRFIAPLLTPGGTTQLDLLLKSLRPPSESEVQQARRPRTLAPLELPEEVREAQRQKLKQQDGPLNEASKVKSPIRRATACPTMSGRSKRPQLTRSTPVELRADSQLEEVVVCPGTLAPLYTKPGPPTPQIRAPVTYRTEEATQSPSSLLQATRRRRLRLRRTQRLEEDQQVSEKSAAGLSVEKGCLAQGVQGRGERTTRGQRHTGKGINHQPPAASLVTRSIRKSHQEHHSPTRPAEESGRRERVLDGVTPSPPNWRLGSNTHLVTNHSIPAPL